MSVSVTNEATDPSFEDYSGSETHAGGTQSSSTEWAKSGTKSVKLVPSSDSSYAEVELTDLVPGQAYTIVYTIRRVSPGRDGGLYPSPTLYPSVLQYPDEEA
jgi:hypothetical protein